MQIASSSPNESIRLDVQHKPCQSSLTEAVVILRVFPTVFVSDFLADLSGPQKVLSKSGIRGFDGKSATPQGAQPCRLLSDSSGSPALLVKRESFETHSLQEINRARY